MSNFFESAVDSATNAVNTAKNTFSESGPAAALSGAVGSISGAVSGAISSVVGSVGNILSSIGSGIAMSDAQLPLKNVLHDYASYNYIISIGCLDADSFNYPDMSYMAGKYPPLVLKSGNSEPNNRISQPDGKFDYYIDSLTVVGQYGFEKGTGNTNSTNVEMTVVEPYSMGMFMMATQQAAYEAGYENYNEAPFLLMIEFKGADQSGNMKSVPNTKKFIPFTFNNMTFKVTGAGSVYTIIGTIANNAALTDGYKNIPNDVAITGKTVQEILQTGPNSLQVLANARFKQNKDDKQVKVQDEIVILFPKDISSKGSGTFTSTADKEDSTGATQSSNTQIKDSKLFEKLGVSRSSTNQTLVQSGDCNALGRASLGFDASRPGDKPMTNAQQYYDSSSGTWIRGQNIAPPGQVVMQFGQNSDIVNIINQVLIKSDASKAALDPSQITTEGMRPWWRVDTQVYHIKSNENLKTTGQIPKLIVYRVVPYQVHSSRLLPPNAPAPGIPALKKQAAKVYDYIYSGKNVDLLRFDIDISNTFYNPTLADGAKRTEDKKQSDSQAAGDKTTDGDVRVPTGANPARNGSQPTVTRPTATKTSSDNKGGTRGETEANRVARMFHDSLINGIDMMNINFDIVGDPYYIANSGAGNYSDNPTNLINVTKDGNCSFQNGEVDVVINFRTPTDINQSTGLYNLNNTKVAQGFSGLYKLTTITSTFAKGVFKQNLKAMRRQGQDSLAPVTADTLMTSLTSIANAIKGTGTAATTPAASSGPVDASGNPVGNDGWGEG